MGLSQKLISLSSFYLTHMPHYDIIIIDQILKESMFVAHSLNMLTNINPSEHIPMGQNFLFPVFESKFRNLSMHIVERLFEHLVSCRYCF